MAFLLSEQIVATAVVKTVTSLTVPAEATGAQLQSDTNDVRYTMDDATDPTQTEGMILVNGLDPEEFLIGDVRKIRFIRGAASDGNLNIHYYTGRIVSS